jgi:hypothetical protein
MEPLTERRKAILADQISLLPDPKRPMGFRVVRTRRSRFSDDLVMRMAFRDTPPRSANMNTRILAEGDSWCNLLWPISGYPKTLVDVLSEQFYTVNLGWPGDTIEKILSEQQAGYKQQLQSNTYDFFIFSAGGVDFFTALAKFARRFEEGGGSTDPNDYIRTGFDTFLTEIKARYKGVAKQVTTWTTRTTLLLHGYDYAVPKPGGEFLGRRFEALGYSIAGGMPKKIVREGIDRYYAILEEVAASAGGRVKIVNCRDAIGAKWHDEIHATSSGAAVVASRFLQKMGLGSIA